MFPEPGSAGQDPGTAVTRRTHLQVTKKARAPPASHSREVTREGELFQEPGSWGVCPAGRQGLSPPLQTSAVNQQV